MISLHISHAEILPRGEAVMNNGQPVRYSKVLWMGGSMSIPNPNDHKGICTDVVVEIEANAAPKSYNDRETKTTSLSIGYSIKPKAIISAKASK